MAHGYLVNQFLSPESNIRTDDYGGDTIRRSRFAREIVENIRKRSPKDYPVICRISADEYTDTGLKPEESKGIAKILEKAGAVQFTFRHATMRPHFLTYRAII